MSIWLQKSASIQKRTSLLKFDHFRNPKTDFTASDLSTKVPNSPWHLLGLDLYNRPTATLAERWALVKKELPLTIAARQLRIVPAFGVGGVVNRKLREAGHVS